ncbi:hypothetical protein [Roseibium salinum]|uniref:Uncharacterized protein n=1 Tax=Roseibium salinum TaxID=1604349 RepID=A0ABT3R0J6_9HYPH|nr:hypothetical protein [Roseibium sp. DSM 29163]MCX2722618.1 hypothetical protein [Roseibium sp. DSM 29163]MDN3719419.1 hypothetical protein [Roseibium salinum]
MPLTAVVEPEELKKLTKVLDDYCLERNIPAGDGRDNVAYRILGLYKNGVTDAENLKAALENSGSLDATG